MDAFDSLHTDQQRPYQQKLDYKMFGMFTRSLTSQTTSTNLKGIDSGGGKATILSADDIQALTGSLQKKRGRKTKVKLLEE